MIAKLTGVLDESGPDWAVIDVAGVGYLVHCSARTLSALGGKGDEVTLFTDLQVSENDMRLLGFATGVVMWVLDMPSPALWGAMAAVLKMKAGPG